MTPTPPALALASHAVSALDLDESAKHLSGRKGSDVWRAGDWAIKTATEGARGHLSHEIHAYALMHQQGRHPGPTTGSAPEGRWMAIPWIEGRSLWEIFAPAREGHATPNDRAEMRKAAERALEALQQFQPAGWIHGDMQTENVLVRNRGDVEFIDFDNAHHPHLSLPFPYRGGLVHVIAPEIASLLLATSEDEHVELTPEAELYALGASLYWAWTGQRITAYQGDPAGPHEDLFVDIAAGHRRELNSDRPWPDPLLEALITKATTLDPLARRYDPASPMG